MDWLVILVTSGSSAVVQKGLVMVTTCYNHGNLHKWGYIPYNHGDISSGTAPPSGQVAFGWACEKNYIGLLQPVRGGDKLGQTYKKTDVFWRMFNEI